ncbi:hypothetical protein C6361_27470 [Plantactinospora sp. BC1]|uniref:hypothetical protein n=1 Tax=Plantactinospora sp. BC1 TaxID=2108470 RepID=UPI000D152994|nr:hypothetical protein [Plantactinospora sp. BC1]AVT34848.1 hypothetical protein C6361_27470 [Plantactinospora sp. BC1]
MLEPILVSVAAALAAQSATSLYDLVKRRFAGREDAEAALEAVSGASPGSPQVAVLAAHLAAAETEDPMFGVELRHTWQQVSASRSGVVNQITGNVSGKVVQARNIEGGITF